MCIWCLFLQSIYALNPKVLRHIRTLNHPSLSNLPLLILVLIMLRYQPSLLGALSILVSISSQIKKWYSQSYLLQNPTFQILLSGFTPKMEPLLWSLGITFRLSALQGCAICNILIILIASLPPSVSGLEFALDSKTEEFLVASYSYYPRRTYFGDILPPLRNVKFAFILLKSRNMLS